MKSLPRPLLTLLSALLFSGTNPAHSAVTADGVVSIDANSTPGTILASTGTVDLALNLGAASGATINGISFTGAALTAGTPVVGAGATLTPGAPTGAGTSLRNLDLNGFLWTTTGDFAGVMNDAVDTQRFPGVAADALNFTITGLDANRFYFIQLLSGDTRSENEDQNYTLGGVTQNAQFGDGGTNDGALVKFTVTGETTLTLSVSNVTGNSPPMLAGILIRSVEPGLFAPLSVSGTSDGTPSTLTVQVVNGASTGYNITGASYSGPNAGDFSNGTAFPLGVPAASNADFTVNVIPTAGGTRTATLTLNTNDPSAPTIDVDLSVDVTDPEIAIDPSLDFGNTPTLPGPVVDDVFVDNYGGATNLTVSAPVITGPGAAAFTVTSLPAPITPGGFDSVEVTYNPAAPGYHTATLALTTNDPFTPTVTVQLSGEVTGDLISPVTVAAVSSENLFGLNRDANNTINGSGLTGLGSAGSTHGIGENALVWTSNGNIAAPNDLAPQITCDLGALYQVTRIREWGYNDPTLNTVLGTQANIIGPDQVEIFTSSDNVNYASAGTVNFALATGAAGYSGNDIPVTLPAARYLRLVIKSNHAGALFDGTGANPGATDNRGLTGLSEVRFEGTPVTSTPFESWLDGHSLAGADRDPDADPDDDGTPNLVEFVIGGDPTISDTDKLPQSEVIGGNLKVTFDRPDSVSGVSIRFEVGTDLVNWPDVFTVGTSPEVAIDLNGAAPDTVTLTLPQASHSRRFVRLVAEPTP
jgi:hypothetical protein